MLADLTIEELRGVPVARLEGEIDASNAAALTTRLLEAVPNSAMGLVVDLCGTEYIDSAGLQMLYEVGDRLRRRQQVLRVVVEADSFAADLLEAVDLGEVARRDPSVAQAVADLSAQP